MQLTSHRHGRGKYARDAWGSREDCKECSEYDARMEKARQHCAREAEKAAKFTDGTPVEVDADADDIIQFEYIETDRRRKSRRAADTRQSFAAWTFLFAVLIFALGVATGYYLGALEAVEIWRANQ